jgi:VCBS repeat-containing protein
MLVSLMLAACGGGGGGGNNNGGGSGGGGTGGGGTGGGGTGGGGTGGGGGGGTNGAPTVTASSFTVDQDTDLTGKITASDPENDPLTLATATNPAHGTLVSFAADGSFVYRPNAGYRGTDTFDVTVADASHTVSATITITVAAVNHAPVIKNDIVTISASTPVIDVLANDSDPDNDPLTLSIDENPVPDTVSAAVVNGKVELTLPSGFRGFTRFRYHAQDPAGLGSTATVAVFVDTQPVRLVYQTNESIDAQNLFVDDLTGRQQISSFTSASPTSLGHSNVSKNGRTIVWEEATGSDATSDYQAQAIWTVPADLSSAPRKISPILAAGEKVNVRSPISPDGQYIVYGVTSAGGTETLYLANLLPGGTSVPIPPPRDTVRIESVLQSILFGPSSKFVYFTATSNVVDGQATYRIPVSDPSAAVRISTAPVANRDVAVRLIANDDSRVIELVAVDGSAPVIERVDFTNGAAGTPITLSHTMAVTDSVVDLKADEDLVRIAYIVSSSSVFALAFADVATPDSGKLVGPIPSDALTPSPRIDAVRATGDVALVHTLKSAGPPVYDEVLAEVALVAGGGGSAVVQSRPQGLNVYAYVDNYDSIAYTSDVGVAVAPRSSLGTPQVVLSAPSVFFEFSADSQLVAGITDTRALYLASRSGGPPLPLTGVKDPSSQTLSVRLVPAN